MRPSRNRSVRRRRWPAALLTALALIAAACGGGGSGDEEAVDPTVAAPTEAPEGDDGGTDDAGAEPTEAPEGDDAEPEEEPTEAPADEERTASDVGVAEDTIEIGFISGDTAGLAGLPVILDVDPPEYGVPALIDDINANGGINGRIIDLKTYLWDPLDIPASLDAICLQAGQDDEVFAVFTPTYFGEAVGCLAGDNNVPMLFSSTLPPGQVESTNGNGFLLDVTHDAALSDAISVLGGEGVFEGKTTGFVYDIEPGQEPLPEIVQSSLAAQGYEAEEFQYTRVTLGTDPSIAAAAQNMSAAGIDLVLLMNNSTTTAALMNEADLIGWNPTWILTDMSEQTSLITVNNAPASQLVNAIGVSAQMTSRADGEPTTPIEDECVEFRSGIDGAPPLNVPGSSEYLLYVETCALVRIMEQALVGAGVNPTRESFVQSLADLGTFTLPAGGAASFGPGKVSAPDEYRLLGYQEECEGTLNGCFVSTSDWIPAGT